MWGCLPVRLYSSKVVFMWDYHPLRLSSCEVVFLWGCLPVWSSSCEVFFLWGCLPFYTNLTTVLSRGGGGWVVGWNQNLSLTHPSRAGVRDELGKKQGAAKYLEILKTLQLVWLISPCIRWCWHPYCLHYNLSNYCLLWDWSYKMRDRSLWDGTGHAPVCPCVILIMKKWSIIVLFEVFLCSLWTWASNFIQKTIFFGLVLVSI